MSNKFTEMSTEKLRRMAMHSMEGYAKDCYDEFFTDDNMSNLMNMLGEITAMRESLELDDMRIAAHDYLLSLPNPLTRLAAIEDKCSSMEHGLMNGVDIDEDDADWRLYSDCERWNDTVRSVKELSVLWDGKPRIELDMHSYMDAVADEFARLEYMLSYLYSLGLTNQALDYLLVPDNEPVEEVSEEELLDTDDEEMPVIGGMVVVELDGTDNIPSPEELVEVLNHLGILDDDETSDEEKIAAYKIREASRIADVKKHDEMSSAECDECDIREECDFVNTVLSGVMTPEDLAHINAEFDCDEEKSASGTGRAQAIEYVNEIMNSYGIDKSDL